MAFQGLKLFRMVRSVGRIYDHHMLSTSIAVPILGKNTKLKEFKTENEVVYLEDPDTFGTLTRKTTTDNIVPEDEGDIKEQQYLENLPLPSQKFSIKQYSDLIKQYVKQKRLKEAIDILEVRMLTQDRVKPDNYIYNILIGACADVGYTKKAFKLFNDMKRRALIPTGDTYTCLFTACANSPWSSDGLKNAHHLRALMNEKGIDPNLTNYNAMIKAFGQCGDISTAFKIVDEMVSKKIKIRVHTLNHVLHACITDKNSGLRHGLLVWRKMLKLREKPNIYTFNLMLKCVKECNLGSKEDIGELIGVIQEQILAFNTKTNKIHQLESPKKNPVLLQEGAKQTITVTEGIPSCRDKIEVVNKNKDDYVQVLNAENSNNKDKLTLTDNMPNVTLELIDKPIKKTEQIKRTVPNLLSKFVNMQQVLSIQEVHTVQDKFAIVGGQEDFLKEMESYSVKPNIKTITQMLTLIDETDEAENKLIETMKALEIKADIDFYNMLIKRRCMRSDYDSAFEVKKMIKEESEFRKKRYFLNKKLRLKMDIITYGVFAMACKTKEQAETLLQEMKDDQLKVNIEILGTLLRQGTAHNRFDYVLYIMNIVKEENIKVNDIFIKHLETFNNKCSHLIQQKDENGKLKSSAGFVNSCKKFSVIYGNWLKETGAEEALQAEHPWKQFREDYPETLQRGKFEIIEPKKFYKRNRKFVPYTPKL